MSVVSCNESCSVNVPEFDQDHQRLYEMVNSLHNAMITGQARTVISNLLDELIGYTQMHFGNEEIFMEARGFPGLAEHRAEHRKLTEQVLEFRACCQAGAPIPLYGMPFLRDWLTQHIESSDKLYSILNIPVMPMSIRLHP